MIVIKSPTDLSETEQSAKNDNTPDKDNQLLFENCLTYQMMGVTSNNQLTIANGPSCHKMGETNNSIENGTVTAIGDGGANSNCYTDLVRGEVQSILSL